MRMRDLVEGAYEDGVNDGKRGHRNPRASSIYGPSSDHYEKGYQAGIVLGKKEGEKNARRYNEWLKPFLHLSNEELHDLAEKFRTSPEDRMANGQPYPYNSKFQAIHQVLGHRKHNPNYGLDSEQDVAENGERAVGAGFRGIKKMKIKELAGLSPIELLKEEEYDYYRDYKHGLISYDEYKQLVNQFQGRSRHRHHSSYNTKPVMTGMYFYDVKPGEEDAADLYGIKKTKSGKWALIQYDTSGLTFNWTKKGADKRFGPGKFWSPKKESVAEGSDGKIRQVGYEKGREFYISPNTGKKVYKKANVGDHETPSGELKPKVRMPYKEDVAEGSDEQIDGMAQGEIREIIKNALHIKKALDSGVSLDGWMYSYVTTSNDHLNSVAEQIGNSHIKEAANAAQQAAIAIAKKKKKGVKESATVGATSAANIGTVVSPQLSPGKARGKKSYTGSMATGSGTKAPPQPKVVQPKNADGTAKNGLEMKGNIFGGPAIKR